MYNSICILDHRRLYPVMIYAPTRGGYVLTGVINLYTDGIHFLIRQNDHDGSAENAGVENEGVEC